MTKTERKLRESILQHRLEYLDLRVTDFRRRCDNNEFGPRFVRWRTRIMEEERLKLAADARMLGYKVK